MVKVSDEKMSKELDKVIRYVYNEFGQEFGDIIVDLKHQLQAYKDKEDKLREYIDGDEVGYYFFFQFCNLFVSNV